MRGKRPKVVAPTRFNGMINVPYIQLEYRKHIIEPKLDMGSTPWQSNGNMYRKGYIVTKNNMLAMPGGAWFSSVTEAKVAIDLLIESEGDAEKFWHLMREEQGLNHYAEV